LLRHLVDTRKDQRYLILGSASRDLIRQLGITIPAATLRRFWTMVCHYHGQVLNHAEFARSFGISDMTVRRYLDILEGTFVVRLLQAWHVNVGKRQVKRPKLYLRDSGLMHALLAIRSESDLAAHNKLGASWEGFALEVACQRHQGPRAGTPLGPLPRGPALSARAQGRSAAPGRDREHLGLRGLKGGPDLQF